MLSTTPQCHYHREVRTRRKIRSPAPSTFDEANKDVVIEEAKKFCAYTNHYVQTEGALSQRGRIKKRRLNKQVLIGYYVIIHYNRVLRRLSSTRFVGLTTSS